MSRIFLSDDDAAVIVGKIPHPPLQLKEQWQTTFNSDLTNRRVLIFVRKGQAARIWDGLLTNGFIETDAVNGVEIDGSFMAHIGYGSIIGNEPLSFQNSKPKLEGSSDWRAILDITHKRYGTSTGKINTPVTPTVLNVQIEKHALVNSLPHLGDIEYALREATRIIPELSEFGFEIDNEI